MLNYLRKQQKLHPQRINLHVGIHYLKVPAPNENSLTFLLNHTARVHLVSCNHFHAGRWEVCVGVCVSTLRLLITSGMIWIG